MYASYWNLNEKPFQNVTDTRFAYLAEQHKEGLARLLYLVDGRKLGGVLVGPYGVGKSMILELLGDKVRSKKAGHFAHVDTPPSGTLSLARQITGKLGIQQPIQDVTEALNALESFCAKKDEEESKHLVIALDEAQMLQENLAHEFLHLLTNINVRRRDGTTEDSAVTLILSGHRKLVDFVTRDSALSQRMQLFWELHPLSEKQIAEYVHFRIRAAGGDIWMFEEECFGLLHEASKGLPRLINSICDIAMLLGCASNVERIDLDVMQQAVEEARSPLLDRALEEVDL
jgi:general secretion pathway protein A